jgi:hypothetical protein
MQAQAAPKAFGAAFSRGESKDGLFRLIYFKSALKLERSACVLARNELAASAIG